MSRRAIGKKKSVDLLAYTMLLIHNNAVEGVVNEKQIDNLMKFVQKEFDNDEQKAIDFIKDKVKEMLKDLEKEVEADED